MTNHILKKGINDLESCYPEIAKEWDYQKNAITPDCVVFGSNKKYFWKCNRGHSWETSVVSRTGRDKTGCPICSNKKVLKGFNDLESQFPELMIEWDYEKNEIAPDSITSKSGKTVWWKCKNGHTWQTIVAQRTSKNTKCPICSGRMAEQGVNDITVTDSYLLDEWDFEKNVLTPTMFKAHSQQKVWWKCKECGLSYQKSVDAKRKSMFCPDCAKGLKVSFPEKVIYYYVKKAYPDAVENYRPQWLNGYELDVFVPALNTGIEFDGGWFHNVRNVDLLKNHKCQAHGVDLIRVRDAVCEELDIDKNVIALKKYSYPEYQRVTLLVLSMLKIVDIDVDIERDKQEIRELIRYTNQDNNLETTHPDLCKQWNVQKNLPLTPSKVTFGSSQKVWWICESGHEWSASISNRARLKRGCPFCSGHDVLPGINDVFTLYPELKKEWSYDLNNMDSSLLSPKSHQEVWWCCEKNHTYQARISSKTSGTGCPFCKNRKILKGFNDLQSQYPDLAQEWLTEKNNILPESVLYCSQKKFFWRCINGHEYEQSPYNRIIHGRSCPSCKREQKSRK